MVVDLGGRFVHQRPTYLRELGALDEEIVTDGYGVDASGVVQDAIIVAAVLQLPNVDVVLSRVLRSTRCRCCPCS